jgi:predicted CXXCH cytochrome family protein
LRTIIRHIARKSRGGLSIREETVDLDVVIAGRGPDCPIHLPDPRVLLHHAEFSLRNGDLYVTAPSNADVRINGNFTHMGKVTPNDVVHLGPYEIKREAAAPAPAESELQAQPDIILTVELVQPLGDDLQDLVKRSRIHVTRVGLTLRTWSWLLAGLAAVLLFIAPFALNMFHPKPDARVLTQLHTQPPAAPTGVWTAGTVSSSHKFFGVACETCHEKPFIPVRNAACLGCHDGVNRHMMMARFPGTTFAEAQCADCHKEHRGNMSITRNDEAFCVSCHADIETTMPSVNLHNVTDFGVLHPQFRPAVVTDTVARTFDHSRAIGDTPPPQENNGLIFPHAKHLRAEGVRDPVRGTVKLRCEDCHTPIGNGHSMKPVTFEEDCHGCHVLKFDPLVPDRELMHGKPQDVFKQIRDIYDAVAMRGGYQEPAAPAAVRRRPGTPLSAGEKQQASAWAAAKTTAVINGHFGKGLCGGCHEIIPAPPAAAAPDGKSGADAMPWDVKPVLLATSYLQRSDFTHAPHRDVACVTCHAAKTSASAKDVLLPGVGVCQSCHGGEKSTDRVPSTCVTCHKFHRKGATPMTPVKRTVENERSDIREATPAPAEATPGETPASTPAASETKQ